MKLILLLSILFMIPLSTLAQNWLDPQLYPFTHRYLPLPDGKMHYIDEGEGDILLFIHGTPTWSFLYREIIQSLSSNYRCIAIDHLGFGLSERSAEFSGSPQAHAANLLEVIEQLQLTEISLVVHDFGGPIGIAAALEQSDRIKQVILFNSWLWETKQNPAAKKIDKLLRSRLGRFLYLRMNVSPRILLKQGFADKRQLTKNIHRHYLAPFPDKSSRYALLQLGQSLVGASDWYQDLWNRLDPLVDKPWLILWGREDSFITEDYLKIWRQRLPHAQVQELACGHFVQEEQTEAVIKAMVDYLERNQ
ncbi:MAG: alpha/beta fold hydrolase [Bacteroidota bacterium]